jgi:hypothetical protein
VGCDVGVTSNITPHCLFINLPLRSTN